MTSTGMRPAASRTAASIASEPRRCGCSTSTGQKRAVLWNRRAITACFAACAARARMGAPPTGGSERVWRTIASREREEDVGRDVDVLMGVDVVGVAAVQAAELGELLGEGVPHLADDARVEGPPPQAVLRET